MARADTPKSDNLEETIPVPGSTRKGRDKKDKEREQREKEKEKEREKEKSKEVTNFNPLTSRSDRYVNSLHNFI